MVMAAVVLVLRPANCRLIRKEVWAMGAASLLLFGVSYAVLFHLYLPNRYTYPLTPFFCIVIAVSWYPLWNAYGERLRWLLPVLAVGMPAAVIWYAGSRFDLGLLLPPATLWDTVVDGWLTIACTLAAGAVLAAVVYFNRTDRALGRPDRAALRRARGIPADRSRDRGGMADQQGARLQQGSAAVQLPADVAEDGRSSQAIRRGSTAYRSRPSAGWSSHESCTSRSTTRF